MREIFLVSGDSTESSLVFKTSHEDGAEEFFIAVTDELRDIVAGHPAPAPVADTDANGVYVPGGAVHLSPVSADTDPVTPEDPETPDAAATDPAEVPRPPRRAARGRNGRSTPASAHP